jgi:hypothetical protein
MIDRPVVDVDAAPETISLWTTAISISIASVIDHLQCLYRGISKSSSMTYLSAALHVDNSLDIENDRKIV